MSWIAEAPLDWREVTRGKIRLEDFTIRSMRRRVESKGDLFNPVLNNRQKLPFVLPSSAV